MMMALENFCFEFLGKSDEDKIKKQNWQTYRFSVGNQNSSNLQKGSEF